MYDWELTNYLNSKNHIINQDEYINICNSCPQLREIKYEPFENIFKAWSDDGEYFEFSVKYEK